MIYRSSSSEDTKRYGENFARRALKRGRHPRHATVIALQGDLGAGKTTFTQGFFKGLGIKRVPNSPTFILMRRTSLKRKSFKNVFHIDAYRLSGEKALEALEFKDLVRDPSNIILIEWPERVAKALPKKRTVIRFKHGKTADARTLAVRKGVVS
jgi:tRNA threonylcarbamoyladenosine biosynthesis protein TsaE